MAERDAGASCQSERRQRREAFVVNRGRIRV
jgi:hypothetical protein